MGIFVVGLPYYNFKNLKPRLGDLVYLEQDKDNQFSSSAISVYLGYTKSLGGKIGYVASRQSASVLEYIKSSGVLGTLATIKSINTSKIIVEYIPTTINSTCVLDSCTISNTTLSSNSISASKYEVNPYLLGSAPSSVTKNTNSKENNMFDKIVNTNKVVATNAGYMEAGRIANRQLVKLVACKAPLMIRGYVDTPIGKLVLANVVAIALEKLRPGNTKLSKLANHMMANAYQELIQTIDIDGLIDELTSSEGIQKALNKLEAIDDSTAGDE